MGSGSLDQTCSVVQVNITKFPSQTRALENPTKAGSGAIEYRRVLGIWPGGFHVERRTELLGRGEGLIREREKQGATTYHAQSRFFLVHVSWSQGFRPPHS